MNKLDVISKPTIASHSHSMITAAMKIISNLTPTHTVFTLCYFVLFIFQYNTQYNHSLMYILTPHSWHYYTMVTQSPTVENTLWWSTGCSVVLLVFESIASVNSTQSIMRWRHWSHSTLHRMLYRVVFNGFFFYILLLIRCFVAVGRRVPMVSRAIFSNERNRDMSDECWTNTTHTYVSLSFHSSINTTLYQFLII